jgi:DNA-binding CsgD family transcriptional regulator
MAMANIAAAACSGATVQERASEVIDCLRAVVPFEGGAILSVDPLDGAHRILANHGYPPRVAAYLQSVEHRLEFVEPFALPRHGWPVRERDLPIDPLTLPRIRDYFRPAGYQEGLLSALVTRGGRHVGVLDLGVSDIRHPTDEACAILGLMAPSLAKLTDPLESAAAIAAMVDSSASALAVLGDGSAIHLRGHLSEAGPDMPSAAVSRRSRSFASFVWPAARNGWLRYDSVPCDPGLTLLIERPADLHALTRREVEVLTCIVDGQTNPEIAVHLHITTRTVKAHVGSILAKLGVRTRAAAAVRAAREGLTLPSAARSDSRPLTAHPGAQPTASLAG